MVCALPGPVWTNLSRPGLKTATENIADNSIQLVFTEASPSSPASFVYYNIYYGTDFNTFTETPQLVSSSLTVSVPDALADPDMYFAVRAAQLGVSGTLTDSNLTVADSGSTTLFLFPAATTLRSQLGIADTHVLVNSITGYPAADGYIEVGAEVIHYSAALASFSGGPAFAISSRDPFGCNTIGVRAINSAVALFRGFEATSGSNVRGVASCGLKGPEWVSHESVGLLSLEDSGDGKTVVAAWGHARTQPGFSRIYYNLYRSSSLGILFDQNPLGIGTGNQAVLTDLNARDGYYYGVHAAYFVSNINTASMTQLSENFWAWPADTTITQTWAIAATGTLNVASTAGYPSAGLLRIGQEIVQYSSKTATTFTVARRDVFALGLATAYAVGETMRFFRGIEDGNRYFYRLTTSFDGYGVQPLPLVAGDGYWGYQYMQDTDGERNQPVDNLSEDHSIQEDDMDGAPEYNYCGFRNTDYVALYSGTFCGGTYQGNTAFGQGGGINLFNESNARNELLLGLTGEPFVLLARKWTGKTCVRLSNRNEHPHARCSLCYGTHYTGGYDRYINTRRIRPAEENPNGFIMCRVSPYNDELSLIEDRGLSQEQTDVEVWTTALPTVQQRDILVRYVLDFETGILLEEFRYEVIRVNRDRLLFSKDATQKITLKRLNKTDEVYKYPITLV